MQRSALKQPPDLLPAASYSLLSPPERLPAWGDRPGVEVPDGHRKAQTCVLSLILNPARGRGARRQGMQGDRPGVEVPEDHRKAQTWVLS